MTVTGWSPFTHFFLRITCTSPLDYGSRDPKDFGVLQNHQSNARRKVQAPRSNSKFVATVGGPVVLFQLIALTGAT